MNRSPESDDPRRTDAEDRYEYWKTSCLSQLSLLTERINGHSSGERIDWTHVGDLAHVATQLEELLDFLTIPGDRIG